MLFLNGDRTRSGEPCPRLDSAGLRVVSGLLTVGLMAGALLISERPALAYVDPGSGFLTLQFFGAWFAGGCFIFRQKIKTFLVRKSTEPRRNTTSSGVPLPPNEGSIEARTEHAEV